ncbi:MAG TPA: hypothetical protein VK993_11975 [Chthoniobacterales bacterium]|nr:hypothetical protein [Chthoniobacterales bacterium]
MEVDGQQFRFPTPYSPEETEFFTELTAILDRWGEEGLTPDELDTVYEFSYEVERRFISRGGWS